jgi:hypothetical protein
LSSQDKRDAAGDNGFQLSLQAGFLTRETWESQATGLLSTFNGQANYKMTYIQLRVNI